MEINDPSLFRELLILGKIIAKRFLSPEFRAYRKKIKAAVKKDHPLRIDFQDYSSEEMEYRIFSAGDLMTELESLVHCDTNEQRGDHIMEVLNGYANIQVENDGINIIATKEGERDDIIIFGAHYDKRGWRSQGAIDNGTGVCTLLKTALSLNDQPTGNSYRFIFFGQEELQFERYLATRQLFDEDGSLDIALLGSKHYLKSLSEEEKKNILYMINVDMIGGKKLQIDSKTATKSLEKAVSETGVKEGVTLWKWIGGMSDHVNFLSYNVPALMLCCPRQVFYIHKWLDQIKRVNPYSMEIAHRLLNKLAYVTEKNT